MAQIADLQQTIVDGPTARLFREEGVDLSRVVCSIGSVDPAMFSDDEIDTMPIASPRQILETATVNRMESTWHA